jgi:hypothetical protein
MSTASATGGLTSARYVNMKREKELTQPRAAAFQRRRGTFLM